MLLTIHYLANPTFLNWLSNDSKPKGNNTKNLVSLWDSFQETSSGYSYFRKEKESPNDWYQAPPSKIVIQKKQRSNDRLVNRNINNNSKILTSRSQALLNRVQNWNIQKHQRKKTADEKDKYSKFMNEAKVELLKYVFISILSIFANIEIHGED